MRYFIKIAYQGTHYHGWQVQDNAVTVQGLIEKKLSCLFSFPITITGSSRTDTGVHAKQQWAHLDLPFSIDRQKLQDRMNTLLPPDIAFVGIYPVKEEAHARYSALRRTYHYSITSYKDPFLSKISLFFRGYLDIASMNQAARLLLEYEDFETFSKLGKDGKESYNCNVQEAYWEVQGGQFVFHITSNRFLRGMVRALVGYLIQIGRAKAKVEDFQYALEQRNRQLGDALAPACGLTLIKVDYPSSIFLS